MIPVCNTSNVYYRRGTSTSDVVWYEITHFYEDTNTSSPDYEYEHQYRTISSYEKELEEEKDEFWHPPYLWIEAPLAFVLPKSPRTDRRWLLIKIRPRAPPK